MKKTIIERMLILWQDQVAAEAHAEAVALAVVHSVAALAAADLEEDLLAVLTAAASEAHITVAHLAAHTVVILAVIIMLPHPLIITITARFSGAQEDALYFTAVAVASV